MRHNDVVESLAERAYREAHWPNGEQREYFDHDRHERDVNTHETQHQITVQHVNTRVLSGILVLQVDGVQHVLDERAEDIGIFIDEQDERCEKKIITLTQLVGMEAHCEPNLPSYTEQLFFES